MGAERIVVADVIERRLEKALQLGAWHVINGRKERGRVQSRATAFPRCSSTLRSPLPCRFHLPG